MSVPVANPMMMQAAAAAAAADDVVTKSVRFNNPDTPEISFTPSSTGDQKKWTTAFWFKRSKLSYTNAALFGAPAHSGNNGIAAFYLKNTDKIESYFDTTGDNPYGDINDRVYRDTAGWMQIIWAVDAVNTTQRFWINGVEETVASATNPPDYAYAMNQSGYAMKLGCRPWDAAANSFDGYIAQCVHLDGQYITDPTEFGQVSSTSGEWEPIELTSSSFTYGTNGALLEFLQDGTSADSSGIGADTSGNANHWSVSGLAAEDIVNDAPENNHAVLNGLDHSGGTTLTEGNLEYDTSGWNEIRGTMAVSSGKWYYEVYVDNFDTSSEAFSVGIAEVDGAIQNTYWSASWDNAANGRRYGVNLNGTTVSKIEGGSASTISATISNGDVISILLDLDSATTTLKFWVNGGSEQTLYSSLAAGTYAIGFNSYTASLILNAGQDPTFAGNDPVGSPATSEFAYTPTSGYKAWAASNLTPTIAKPSEHFDVLTYASSGAKTFDNGGTTMQPDLVWVKSRVSAGAGDGNHELTDSVRGVTKSLSSNSTDEEGEDSDGLTAFGADGFTVGTGTNYSTSAMVAWAWKAGTTPAGTHDYELNLALTDSGGDGWGDGQDETVRLEVIEGTRSLGEAFVGDYESAANYVIKTDSIDAIKIVWNYDESGFPALDEQGGTLTNGATTLATWTAGSPDVSDGAIFRAQSTTTNPSTIGTLAAGEAGGHESYNAAAGFSIVKWTGDTDSGGSTQEVSHSLGVAPELIIAKNRADNAGGNGNWMVYHKNLDSGDLIRLDTNGGAFTPSGYTVISGVTSAKVDFDNDDYESDYLNYSGEGGADTYIAYLFASVAGYSKIGSINSPSSAFCFLGFRPSFILAKRSDATGGNWLMFDDKREGYNVDNDDLFANDSGTENTTDHIDILSNGFRIRTSDSDLNTGTIIYYAVGQSSKYSNAR